MKNLRIILASVICIFALGCSTPSKSKTEIPYQKIELISKDSKTISAYLFTPTTPGPHPAIVALHGCSGLFLKSGELNSRDMEWGKLLSENGYVVLYPDSFNPRGFSEICTQKDKQSMPKLVRAYDAFSALQWLQSQSYVKVDHVAIMGWSNGGSSLLWTIDKNSAAKPASLKNDFKLAIGFYPGCYHADLDSHWANRVPLEILMGASDNWTEPKYCQSLLKKANQNPPMHLTLYPDSYHDFDRPNTPVHEVKNLANVLNQTKATVGTNEVTRKQAIEKALKLLKEYLSE